MQDDSMHLLVCGVTSGHSKSEVDSISVHANICRVLIAVEHRNMPMQDAMMLVAHNYDAYKVENREKEREEIARKAAKMADDVLLREPDRESHPISVLTAITLLSENRYPV